MESKPGARDKEFMINRKQIEALAASYVNDEVRMPILFAFVQKTLMFKGRQIPPFRPSKVILPM